MEDTRAGVTEPRMTVHWLLPSGALQGLATPLREAMDHFPGWAWRLADGQGLEPGPEGASVSADAVLPQGALATWLEPGEAPQAWRLCAASAHDRGVAVHRIEWSDDALSDAPAWQAAWPILLLSSALSSEADARISDLMLDVLLNAEVRLSDAAAGLSAPARLSLSTLVAQAWLALARATGEGVYVQRAWDATQSVAVDLHALPVAQRRAYLRVGAEAQWTLGVRAQDERALVAAVARLDQAAQWPARGERDESWAAVRLMQGHALESLAQWRGAPEVWADAAQAYRDAAAVWTPRSDGARGAAVCVSLGRVLSTWGRQSRDVALLHEAVRVLDEATAVYTEADFALEWAHCRQHSGVALQALGQIQRDEVQVVLALQAYEQALRQRTRAAHPQAWATTLHHQATALAWLGVAQDDVAKLKQAIECFQAALQERRLSSAPRDWAATQQALGRACDALGRRESDLSALEAAIQAHLLAASQRSRQQAPLEWAAVQLDLGQAWLQLGERSRQLAALRSAESAYDAALEVLDPSDQAAWWRQAANNKALALRLRGAWGGHLALLQQAAQVYASILAQQGASMSALDRVPVVEGLALCQLKQADLSQAPEPLRQVLALLSEHLPGFEAADLPQASAMRQQWAQVCLRLASEHDEPGAAEQAVAAAQLCVNNSAEPLGSAAGLQTHMLLATALTWQALAGAELARLDAAKQTWRSLLQQLSRQRHTVMWAQATGFEALCDVMLAALRSSSPEQAAAQAVLTQMQALLWRLDASAALRLERAHAMAQRSLEAALGART
jgi:tetratricopeptide (TPR) repeat protein